VNKKASLSKDELRRKFLTMLGFAQKAGQVVSGEQAVFTAIKGKNVHLLLIAEDASPLTKEKVAVWTASYPKAMKIIYWGSKKELGLAIGKAPRSLVGIKDNNFAQTIAVWHGQIVSREDD